MRASLAGPQHAEEGLCTKDAVPLNVGFVRHCREEQVRCAPQNNKKVHCCIAFAKTKPPCSPCLKRCKWLSPAPQTPQKGVPKVRRHPVPPPPENPKWYTGANIWPKFGNLTLSSLQKLSTCWDHCPSRSCERNLEAFIVFFCHQGMQQMDVHFFDLQGAFR